MAPHKPQNTAKLVRGGPLQGRPLRSGPRGAHLSWAHLSGAHLREANLQGGKPHRSGMLTPGRISREPACYGQTSRAQILTGCLVYGVSAWDLNLAGTKQLNLVITERDEPVITVDNLEVAQFIYLLLHNEKIREVIDTITSKAVLILGRFTPDRKVVLDAIRESLRQQNYLPILFDFEKPASRDLTETISTLAHIARFIIADLTEAKSIPQELQRIIPDLPSVPVQPVLQASAQEYSMFEHFTRYPWVLETYRYDNLEDIMIALAEKVIMPAELKANEAIRELPASQLQTLIAFLGMGRLDRLRDEDTQLEKTLRGFIIQITSEVPARLTGRMVLDRCQQIVTTPNSGADTQFKPEIEPRLMRWKALPGEQQRLMCVLQRFLRRTLVILALAIIGFVFANALNAWVVTAWMARLLIILTVPFVPTTRDTA